MIGHVIGLPSSLSCVSLVLVITVIDGYSRVNEISLRLCLTKRKNQTPLNVWMTLTAILGLIIIFFQGQVGTMLRFAMIGSFLTTPFFALLNYVLVTKEKKRPSNMVERTCYCRFDFLFGFALFFIWALAVGKVGIGLNGFFSRKLLFIKRRG